MVSVSKQFTYSINFTVVSSGAKLIFLSRKWIFFTLVWHEQFLCFLLELFFLKMQSKIGVRIIHG